MNLLYTLIKFTNYNAKIYIHARIAAANYSQYAFYMIIISDVIF